MKYIYYLFIFILLNLISSIALSQDEMNIDIWSDYSFLMGEWKGINSGQPGEGISIFSFELKLDSNILYRTDHNEFNATDKNPAFNHDDILIIYKEFSDVPNKAIYFDNEGHLINYTKIEFPERNKSVIFKSDVVKGLPSFKLSYFLNDDGSLKISFDISQPDNPDNFISHVEGTAVRVK